MRTAADLDRNGDRDRHGDANEHGDRDRDGDRYRNSTPDGYAYADAAPSVAAIDGGR